MPLMDGRTESVRQEVFADVSYHASYEPMRCIRTRQYKYIRRFGEDDPHRPVLNNCDDSPSQTLWVDNDWPMVPQDAECLYDVILDPAEQNNLAACPEIKPVLDELSGRLDAWMQATNDPLLGGAVTAPAGAKITYQTAPSPRGPMYVLEEPEVANRTKPSTGG